MSILELSVATGETLAVNRFRVTERVSDLFSIDLQVLSDDPALDLSAILGQTATFRAVAGHAHTAGTGTRTWKGLVEHAEQVHAMPVGEGDAGASTYAFRLVPEAFRLTLRRNHRIFQQKTLPDIVEQILKEQRIPHAFRVDRGNYPRHEYKVQYAETDFAFISRLLEEAGIAFVFAEDASGTTTLVLTGRLEQSPARGGPPLPYVDNPNEAGELEFVTRVTFGRELRPGAVTLRDHDPRRPTLPLFGQAPSVASEARYEQYHYDEGAFLVETGKPAGTPVADDRGLARHDQAHGKALAERLLHGDRVGARSLHLLSNAYDLCPGSIVSIARHPHDALPESRKLLVLATTYEGKAQHTWSLGASLVPADMPYRPPRRTPKPVVHGVQEALVVGPAGQEIHTDEFGRVRVEMRWDRAGHRDQKSSCWVRVIQGWGGIGYGMLNLPRIGQEVLLTFLEGDPDQPVIGGRVFNEIEQVPHRLPDHKTRSTWKSSSSPGSAGFNEIMLEDLSEKELVWQQAQKDRVRLVEDDEFVTVAHDRQKLVKNDEADHTDGNRKRLVVKDADDVVKKDRRERVEEHSHVEVRGDRRELVKGDQSVTVLQEQHERVNGRFALHAKKKVHTASEVMVGEAAEDITLKGPGGFVRIDSGGVTIVGTLVKINVSGSPGKGPGAKPVTPDAPVLATADSAVSQDVQDGKPNIDVKRA